MIRFPFVRSLETGRSQGRARRSSSRPLRRFVVAATAVALLVPFGLGPAAVVTARTPSAAPTSTSSDSVLRYVARTGSDAGDGSRLHPWRTIQHAVDIAPSGALIIVHGGTYAPFTVSRSRLTVAGATGETAVVSGGTYVVHVNGVTSATIRNLTIRDAPDQWGSGVRVDSSSGVVIEGNIIRDNHSFGIKAKGSTRVTIRNNEILKNDTGIELSAAGEGIVVSGNRIHDNDGMVTSSRGGNAIVFTKTTGRITVSGNQIWGNRAPHLSDPGYDGGAFEVYAASNLWIEGNVVWDNNNVMETGTDGTAPCLQITFVRNIAYGAGTVPRETQGMILRCASNSLVANNTFDGLDTFAFYVTPSGSFAGSIDGLRITNNIVVNGRAYSLESGIPSSVVIDQDLAFNPGSTADYGQHLAYVAGRGNTDSLDEFRSWTGYETHGIAADPLLVDAARRDYHLMAGSPAINEGTVILSDGFAGSAPDLGRYEYGQ